VFPAAASTISVSCSAIWICHNYQSIKDDSFFTWLSQTMCTICFSPFSYLLASKWLLLQQKKPATVL
jgi:hypothetical protein